MLIASGLAREIEFDCQDYSYSKYIFVSPAADGIKKHVTSKRRFVRLFRGVYLNKLSVFINRELVIGELDAQFFRHELHDAQSVHVDHLWRARVTRSE